MKKPILAAIHVCWIQAKERHLKSLACQSCHVPLLSSPTLQAVDYSVLTPQGGPRMQFRRVQRLNPSAPSSWFVEGYRPFLLWETRHGQSRFAPYNLVAAWKWVDGKSGKEIARDILERVWLTAQGNYQPSLVAVFDANHDGALQDRELVVDTKLKEQSLLRRFESLGIAQAKIKADVEAYAVRHGVTTGKWATASCDSCHGKKSRFAESIALATGPFSGGVIPKPSKDVNALLDGRQLVMNGIGLEVVGVGHHAQAYVPGHDTKDWSEKYGFLLFVLVMFGVMVHAAARAWISHKRKKVFHAVLSTKRVYMYGAYERVWHWTMVVSVLFLLVTGFQIHYPHSFRVFRFSTAVFVHNFMAVVMILNAFLSLFFHLASGEIKQFIPERSGFIRGIVAQLSYYGKGMFMGANHPVTKTREKKLNPLQRVAYVGLLNVLFPIQILSGVWLWLGGVYPDLLLRVGGVPMVAPLHIFSLGICSFLGDACVSNNYRSYSDVEPARDGKWLGRCASLGRQGELERRNNSYEE
ncbi:MAG: cytochrome b/b6 domain-containing protein [Myxococcales bacterium]|nr:MAG: cytochrome b/b6 domain-containing protein [Myxococcales bacterium]